MKKISSKDWSARHASFENWFQTPLGRALYADQCAYVDSETESLAGARQLHVSISHRLPVAVDADFSQRLTATPRWVAGLPDSTVVCDADELPFPGDSMDLVILHHTADFSAYPHQVVREACRVLRGGGQLLIIGFNPLSLWGLRKLISRTRGGPWGGRFMLRSRMEDWLSLLDFSIEASVCHFYRAPLKGQKLNERRERQMRSGGSHAQRLLPVGAYYSILATKRVCAPLARKPAWRRKNVIGLPVTPSLGAPRGFRCQPPEKRKR